MDNLTEHIEDSFLPKSPTWTGCGCRYCQGFTPESISHSPTWICRAFYDFYEDQRKPEDQRLLSCSFYVQDWKTSSPHFTISNSLNFSQVPRRKVITSLEEWQTYFTSLKETLNDHHRDPKGQDTPDPTLAGSVPF